MPTSRCSRSWCVVRAETSDTADRRMILYRHPASLLCRTEPLRTALIAAAFWTLAVIALTNLRYVHLGGMPQVEVVVARGHHGLLCPLVRPGWSPVRDGLEEVRFTRPHPEDTGRNARHVAVRRGGVLSGDRRRRAGRRSDPGTGYGRVLEVSRPPSRRAHGRRGGRPRGAGTNRSRAVVKGCALGADCELRQYSRFAGPARSRHPAALQDSLSPDRRFRRAQRRRPGRLHDGGVGGGVADQRRAAHARLAGPHRRRRRKLGDGVPNSVGRTRCAGGRVPVDQRPQQSEDLRLRFGGHRIERDCGIRRCRGFLRRFFRVVDIAVHSRHCVWGVLRPLPDRRSRRGLRRPAGNEGHPGRGTWP